MDYQKILQELSLNGLRVFFYCLLHKREEWDHIKYGSWMGLEYSNSKKSWKTGVENLEEHGYLKEGRWTKKVKDILGRKSQEKE